MKRLAAALLACAGAAAWVTALADDVVTVEVAPDVKVRFQRNAIASVKK